MELFLQYVVILLFVFLNGFFVAAEFAIVKVRASKIDQRAAEGVFRAKVAKNILDNLDAYLSACQVGITLASLALGWIGEPFLASQLRPLLHGVGVQSEAVVHGVSFAVAFGIITYLHIVVGEMAPKSLAIRLAEKTTLWTSVPLRIFYRALSPFIEVLNRSALLLLKVVGIQPVGEKELAHSEEELKLIFVQAAQSGHVGGREVEIMENVLGLHNKIARQIMIPRTAVAYVSTTNTFEQNLKLVVDSEHTRYPLCQGDLDHVLGMVHIKDVLAATTRGDKNLRMIHIKRDIIFYPDTITLDVLFREFQRTKHHMAVLIDEFGGTTGIITLEDVLEEMVGEIYDEFDEPESFIRKVGKQEYLIDGLCPVELCEEKLNLKFPEYDVETVGGVVFSLAGHMPKPGETLPFVHGVFIVEAIDRQRIAKVRLILEAPKTEPAVPAGDKGTRRGNL
jgi:CBS domain containing-hemolysin-like protein